MTGLWQFTVFVTIKKAMHSATIRPARRFNFGFYAVCDGIRFRRPVSGGVSPGDIPSDRRR